MGDLSLTAAFLPLRHNTMAIGIAVDILGCTGTLEDRAATLNRVIQVAVELKDTMGDLYSFSAIMKALEMPQVRHLRVQPLRSVVCALSAPQRPAHTLGKSQTVLSISKDRLNLSKSCSGGH